MSRMCSWKLLLVLGALIAVGGGFACSEKQPPTINEPTVTAPTPPPILPSPDPFGGSGFRGIEEQFKDVHFAFDSSALDATAQATLKDDLATMARYQGIKLEVEGHCDERGTSEYNMALGQRRAVAVRDYLVRLGAADAGLQTISYGKEVPIDPGHGEASWAKNRRAHFRVVSVGTATGY